MVNPHRGETLLVVDGETRVARLSLGALAELEAELETGTLVELVERFERGGFSVRDILAVLAAGLRAEGWEGDAARLARADIAGGPIEAARQAALLLARAFALPPETLGRPE